MTRETYDTLTGVAADLECTTLTMDIVLGSLTSALDCIKAYVPCPDSLIKYLHVLQHLHGQYDKLITDLWDAFDKSPQEVEEA